MLCYTNRGGFIFFSHSVFVILKLNINFHHFLIQIFYYNRQNVKKILPRLRSVRLQLLFYGTVYRGQFFTPL